MSTDDGYVGPTLMAVDLTEVTYQFGVRLEDGRVMRLGRDVRAPLNQLVRRRVVPIEEWQPVEQG